MLQSKWFTTLQRKSLEANVSTFTFRKKFCYFLKESELLQGGIGEYQFVSGYQASQRKFNMAEGRDALSYSKMRINASLFISSK